MAETPVTPTSEIETPIAAKPEAEAAVQAEAKEPERGRRGGRGRGGRGKPGGAGEGGAEGEAAAAPEVAVRNPRPARAPGFGEHEAKKADLVTVNEDVDFAALMDAEKKQSKEAPLFEPGTKVKGVVEVVSLHGQEIFLDLGQKATGYIMKEDVRDADGNVMVKPGDVIEGIVVGQDSNGIKIRVKLGQEADARALREAFDAGILVEGKVIGLNKGGYDIRVGNARAFCPHSQIDMVRIEQPETMLGKVLAFKITEIKDNHSVVVSHAAVMKAEAAVKGAELMAKLEVSAKLVGRVRSIQKFGVFVDLGGKDGLVHVSELSWNRVEDPHEVVKLGQEVEVVVLEIDKGPGGDVAGGAGKDKISLSMRKAQEDPFESAAQKLQVGETVNGLVVRLKDFGAFIELAPNVEGLIHISDMAHYRVRHPKDILTVGESVSVKVIEVDVERHRVALSLKALAANPWDDVAARYQVGQVVTGKVESVQEFGVFVALEPGVVALLPASEAKLEGKPVATEFRVGKDVEARVLRIDVQEKKMALTRRDEEELRRMSDRGGDGAGGRGDGGGRDGRGPGGPSGPGRGPGGGGGYGEARQRRDNTMRDVRESHDRRERGRGGDFGGGGGGGGGRGGLAYTDTEKPASGSVGSLGEALMRALGQGKKDGK